MLWKEIEGEVVGDLEIIGVMMEDELAGDLDVIKVVMGGEVVRELDMIVVDLEVDGESVSDFGL